MLGTLRDSYFFKRIDGSDVDLIDIYKTSRPIGYIVGSVLTGISLIFLPVEVVFVIISIFLISAIIPAVCLEDNIAECEDNDHDPPPHSWLYNHFH